MAETSPPKTAALLDPVWTKAAPEDLEADAAAAAVLAPPDRAAEAPEAMDPDLADPEAAEAPEDMADPVAEAEADPDAADRVLLPLTPREARAIPLEMVE